jgi:sugar/nucleoside kinase (ribokinase family)/sugar phosphate isomerase/epimerase
MLVILLIFFIVAIYVTIVDATKPILVVGSINADTFFPVTRLPMEGENVMLRSGCRPVMDVPGGKGCTQAVAIAKLMKSKTLDERNVTHGVQDQHEDYGPNIAVSFCGQLGGDSVARTLEDTLLKHNVETIHCGHQTHLDSGRGYVFRTESGSVSAIVTGGSNLDGWSRWEKRWMGKEEGGITDQELDELLGGVKYVLLQREIPEYVNFIVANEAHQRGILVLQDIGGEDRPIASEMLSLCDFVIPNESELFRLAKTFDGVHHDGDTNSNVDSNEDNELLVVQMAKVLQSHGAKNVLVTRGSKGCCLLTQDGTVLHQDACPLLPEQVIDETGAGDCFRAAFCVALFEGKSVSESLAFASAAGACGVTREGAVPATPSRDEVDRIYHEEMIHHIPRGGESQGVIDSKVEPFPFLFGSRLNSMKDRPDLWDAPLATVRDYVSRQATVQGLTCIDFNYPQHFQCWNTQEAKKALHEVGLVAGAVCLRYPAKFARGAMNHPDPVLRREAIDITLAAARVAQELDCREVVVWSAYDGYDYPFQVDYDEKWSQLVEAFRECCDAFPDLKFSIEYKPTDENTRFFTVPSTGAAVLFARDVDRLNFGLTLDVGHMLMSGENPGQSIAMAGKHLFGIQLNDGYTRLAAEDGLMFGSVHPSMALEIMYQLKRINFSGHFYFDTFPQRTDPVKEAEYNIRRVKRFWAAVEAMDPNLLHRIAADHDALGALNLVDAALRSM